VQTLKKFPLIAISIAAFIARLAQINAPLKYDEAYTYMAFARNSLFSVITDYHLPNNHIFHTILVFFSTQIFGADVWAIRLPAFIAGLLIIPLTYFAARALYDRSSALIAAALAASLPMLIEYSINARGYVFLQAFTLILILLGDHVRDREGWLGWIIISITGAIGLWTIPIMLYPIGILYLWLLLHALSGSDRSSALKRFLIRALISGGIMIALTAILYYPVVRVSGLDSLIGNHFVRSLDWNEFASRFIDWMIATWQSWMFDLPAWAAFGIGIGLIASVILYRHAAQKIPLQLAIVLWFAIILPIQRPDTQVKAFYFIVPLIMIFTASGWIALASFVKQKWIEPAVVITVVAICFSSIYVSSKENWGYLYGAQSEAEKVSAYLAEHYQSGDVILVEYPSDPQIWYYASQRGVPLDAMQNLRGRSSSRVWVLVKPSAKQTLASVIDHKKLDPAPNENSCAAQIEINQMIIYICEP
jgi:uncharacterized membrane protein